MNILKVSSLATLLLATILMSGCSSKEPTVAKQEPSVLIAKHAALPSWVNDEDKNVLSAVGSARYKNQTYMQQQAEAKLSASAELAGKLQKMINTTMKAYHQSTGQNDAELEDVFRQVSTSIASETLSGVVVQKVHVSDDGEMFVKVVVDPAFIKNAIAANVKNNKTVWQQAQAQKAFEELDKSAKAYREERAAVPAVAPVSTEEVKAIGG